MAMSGCERLMAIMHKQPAEGLAWTTLVDNATLGTMPEGLGGNGGLDLYRHLGCDIFLLDCWGLPYHFAAPHLRWPDWVVPETFTDGEYRTEMLRAGDRVLSRVYRRSHPQQYPVRTLEDVGLYRQMWEEARYLPADDSAIAARAAADIGRDGIITRFWGPSAVQRLLETDMGTLNFYYMLHDHRADVEALIDVMHRREREAFEILAQGPVEVLILAENTSTYYISPPVYRRYSKPAVAEFVDIAHAAGKVALVHMCGHVVDLLHDFKDIGMDGIHALTPAPTGNTPWELALDVMGEDTIIVGILEPTVWAAGPVEQIGGALDALYTQRLRRSNFVLWPAADGIPVELARFEAVAHWMARQGR